MDGIGKRYRDLDNDRQTLMEKTGHGQREGAGNTQELKSTHGKRPVSKLAELSNSY